MRRITQYFPAILISGSRGMLAAINIFYQHHTSTAAYASHPANYFGGLLHVMQSEAAHHNIERAFIEGQILRVAHTKRNIFHAAFFGSSAGNSQHRFGQIPSYNFANDFVMRWRGHASSLSVEDKKMLSRSSPSGRHLCVNRARLIFSPQVTVTVPRFVTGVPRKPWVARLNSCEQNCERVPCAKNGQG